MWGEVVARRQTGLEKDPGTIRLRHDPPINEDLDVPGALQNVNAMIGVAGVDKDLLILFVPVILSYSSFTNFPQLRFHASLTEDDPRRVILSKA